MIKDFLLAENFSDHMHIKALPGASDRGEKRSRRVIKKSNIIKKHVDKLEL